MNQHTNAPRFTTETVTPERAREFLGTNVKNRSKKPIKIAQYARDIREGRWAFTGEAIKFDWNGNLIDGQNRCYAVIEAGLPIVTAVARGLDPQSQNAMDSGAIRKTGDQLTIDGQKAGKDVAAALNAWKAWNLGAITHANSDIYASIRLTNVEAVEYAHRNPEFVATVPIANRYKRALHMPIGAIAVAFHEFNRISPEDTDEFFTRFMDLDFSGRGAPIRALKRRIDSDTSANRSRYPLGAALFMLFRTWNAFRENERLLKIQLGSRDRGWGAIPDAR